MTIVKFQIGDWSDDGHGKCDYYSVKMNVDGDGVRKAYKSAKKKLPKCIDPAKIFDEYEDSSLTKEVYETALEHGYDFLKGFKEDKGRKERLPDETLEEQLEYPQIDTRDFLDYIIWFLKQGDPELTAKVVDPETKDVFPSYGEEGFGYGLFH